MSCDNINVLAFGDSILRGVTDNGHLPEDWFSLAEVGRPTSIGINVMEAWVARNPLPRYVFIHLGTNGGMSRKQLLRLLELTKGSRRVFTTVKAPRSWRRPTNILIRAIVPRHPDAVIFDWGRIGGRHPEWFVSDKIHLRTAGAQAYANQAVSAMRRLGYHRP